MEQIPVEIVNEIFSHLHQFDKVTCMCVCKHWKRVIEEYGLYRSVCTLSTKSLNALTTKIQDNPKVADQIEDFVLYGGEHYGSTNFIQLLSSLKNVRRLFVGLDLTEEEMDDLHIDYQFHNTIEYISECSGYSIALKLLLTSTCPMLTTLDVDQFSDEIVKLLGNAPALKRLALRPTTISFHDINTLHSNVTGLQHLEIIDGTIINTGFDDRIEPATSVVACNFWRVFTRVPKNVLEYICIKYPNVSSLTAYLSTGTFHPKESDQETHSGWIKLFRKSGKQLKKLCYFDEADDKDIFQTLDTYHCQLKYLHLLHFQQASLQKIAQSNQILSLQTLVLLLHVVIESLDWLKHLKVLEKFKLYESTSSISLNSILNNCPPKLKSLSLEFVDIADDFEPSTPSNIKQLSFSVSKLPNGIDGYIARHFPALKKLKLHHCIMEERKFDLPTLDLHAVHIMCGASDNSRITNVMISTLKNREQRLYQFHEIGDSENDKNLKPLFPQPLSSLSHENDVSPTFTLVCHSLGKFFSA